MLHEHQINIVEGPKIHKLQKFGVSNDFVMFLKNVSYAHQGCIYW